MNQLFSKKRSQENNETLNLNRETSEENDSLASFLQDDNYSFIEKNPETEKLGINISLLGGPLI